jgi:hypothetical protein
VERVGFDGVGFERQDVCDTVVSTLDENGKKMG